MLLGTFRIGEDIAVALDVVSGDPAEVSTIEAWIVRSLERDSFRPQASFTPVPLTVAPRAASGDIPEGWNLSLNAAQTELLVEGTYGIDAKLTGAMGAIDITDATALVRITKAAVV